MRQKSLLLQAFSSKPLFNPRSTYVDRTLIQEILEIVEQAAIASATLSGKGLKDEADALAVDAMRKRMNQIQKPWWLCRATQVQVQCIRKRNNHPYLCPLGIFGSLFEQLQQVS